MKTLLFAICIFISLLSCEPEKENGIVHYTGALKTIMSGDLSATIALDSLSSKENLYALGAVENLNGEIQIFDGNAFNSMLNNKDVIIDSSFDKKAALLVYAQVEEWQSISLPKEIISKEQLEQFVMSNAKSLGIDTEQPFPFLIEGKVESLNWHIIEWKANDTIHTHQKHKEAGANGILNNTDVSILGFYSTKHKAVFTHHSTFMHMHFKIVNGRLAGHVDDLELNTNCILKLPKE